MCTVVCVIYSYWFSSKMTGCLFALNRNKCCIVMPVFTACTLS